MRYCRVLKIHFGVLLLRALKKVMIEKKNHTTKLNLYVSSIFLALPTLEYDNRLKSGQTAKSGSTVVLKVNVSGIPSPAVSWKLNGQLVSRSDRVTVDTNKDYSTITIKNCMKEDAGIYTIVAENVVGQAVADFDVAIKGIFTQPDPPETPFECQKLPKT